MERLGDAIGAVLKGLQDKSVAGKDPEALCRQVFTPKERRHLKPRGVSKGTFWLVVDSPTWMYHLNLRREELLEKFNGLGAGIRDVRIAVGDIASPPSKKSNGACTKRD